MATSMLSADRRKKVVTYGKSSRLPTVPPPRPPSNEDAPSPERPRKLIATLDGSLKKAGGALKSVGSSGSAYTRTSDPDLFDIPSDDDFVSRPIKPVKQLPVKHRTPEYDFDVPNSEDGIPAPNRRPVKFQPASRKPKPAYTASSTSQKLQKPAPPAKPVSLPPPPSENGNANASQMQRGKTPQPAQKTIHVTANGGLEHPKIEAKPRSRPINTTQAIPKPKPKSLRNPQATSILPPRKTVLAQQAKKEGQLDVFDVPDSDEELPSTAQRRPNHSLLKKSKKPAETFVPSIESPRKDSAESEDSNASRTRKRKGSFSSVVTTATTTKETAQESSVPQRHRKYQKKEDNVSPGHITPSQGTSASELDSQSTVSSLNKPKRTRVRTVPVLEKPTMAKGQSSPAILKSMLSSRQISKPSPIPEITETTTLGDETMYDIPDSTTTPLRSSTIQLAGTVTPRQKALFSSLLGDASSSNTPMPKIAALQLTDRKPKSLIGALSKSKSDLTPSTAGRKTRLIDTIKRAETSSTDEEEEDEDSECESESSEESRGHTTNKLVAEKSRRIRAADVIPSDIMDVDIEAAAESQTSQATSGFGTRSKLTYAKSRSYLEEATFEDALLVSMDLDDNLGLDSQKDTVTEDEYDPMSQVQARHELKKRGQQTAFYWETETLINDISDTTNSSVRRTTMIELCSKMANEAFTSQLLDSSLTNKFFKNISSSGEVIFDFAAVVAIVSILKIDPTSTVLDQLLDISIINALLQIASNDVDIRKIARDRKTNLSKIGQESVEQLRKSVQDSSVWTLMKPEKVSPQLVALKALELLILGLRKTGSTASLIDEDDVSKLVDVTSNPSERLKSGNGLPQDTLVLNLVLSTLEAASIAKQKQSSWPIPTLKRLADLLPIFIQPDTASSTMLAVKLCMNLTNNKPKACQPFSETEFVQPLVSFIAHSFGLLRGELKQDQRTEILESLILSLGATINLAELSDQARLNVDDGKQMISTLVKIFLEGSERAAQADSMEESHSSVAVGYLAVLLGNICLNQSIRSKVRVKLPDQQLNTLIDEIREFVKFHERVDSKSKQFDGDEGREAWQNYTTRLLLVVEKLEQTDV